MIYGLDLFSGIGGLTLALEPWVRPVAYCENDRYAQSVLLSRMRDGALSLAPIWDDVRTLRGNMLRGIDIIYGGFPCQDISVAGLGKGLDGNRSGLFFEIVRLAQEIKPTFLFLENVPCIRTRGLREVIRAITDIGFHCRWSTLSAREVGAPHLRNRWFLLARKRLSDAGREYDKQELKKLFKNIEQERGNGLNSLGSNVSNPDGETLRDKQQRLSGGRSENLSAQGENELGNNGKKESLADSECFGQQRPEHSCAGEGTPDLRRRFTDAGWWAFEPDVGRMAYGIPDRVDRIKSLGNAVVPIQAREAFKRLMGLP